METKQEIAEIRKAIKAKIPTVSVRNGRGTAWGWVEIWGSEAGTGMFTAAEREGLKALGMNPGGNCCNISPDSRGFWHKKLTGQRATGQPCIVCHASGVQSFGCPCDLTHWLCEVHQNLFHDCAFIHRREVK